MKALSTSAGAIALLAASFCPLFAQQTPSTGAADRMADKEPAAMEALNRMGGFLRTLKAFQVEAQITDETVLEDGQKIQMAHRTNLLARQPDRLMVDTEGDTGSRQYVYDGKSFTLFARHAGFYATAPAPPTLKQLVAVLDEKYDIEVPLVDLFLWGQGDNSGAAAITSASDIGPGEVGGVSCEHYAFRQEGLDWQVWIQSGDYPLPRKLVLTTTTDEARPQHSSTLTWNLAPAFNDAAFEFDPPPGTHKIVFAGDSAAAKK